MASKKPGVKSSNHRFASVFCESMDITENMCKDCGIVMKPDLPPDEGTGSYAALCGFTCPKCKKFEMRFGERDAGRKKV